MTDIDKILKNNEEIEILLLAKRVDYIPLEEILTNEKRVLEASSYLETMTLEKLERLNLRIYLTY